MESGIDVPTIYNVGKERTQSREIKQDGYFQSICVMSISDSPIGRSQVLKLKRNTVDINHRSFSVF